MAEDKEKAFIVCTDRRGNLSRGATATGDISNVSVPVKCKRPTEKPLAIVHNHPSNIPLPSEKDMQTSRTHNDIVICVRTDGHGVKCYQSKK